MFSESKIEQNLELGEVYEGVFEIEEEHQLEMEGYVYSSSIRVTLGENHFSGVSASVPYEIRTEGMQPGDVLKGSFSIVSNRGEYVLPFVVMIVHSNLTSSMGQVKNLFHFTNLAKSSWSEAADIFADPAFVELLHGNDSKYRDLYKGLSKKGNKNLNLEEFLIGINKKQKIEYTVAKDEIKVLNPSGIAEHTIDLERNGWGYTLLAAKAEGDFIELTNNRIEDEDFVGDVCHFTFNIHESGLHEGRNFGRITFKHPYGRVSVVVMVTNNPLGINSSMSRKHKSVTFSLIRQYLDYRMGKLAKNKWISYTEDMLNHRSGLSEKDTLENNLYKVHLLLEAERYNEAKWIIDRQITTEIDDGSNEEYCYYLYLMSLYNVDEYYARDIAGRIKSIYDKDPTNWRVAWVLLKVSSEFRKVPSRMYNFALKQVDMGCRSPLLYVEIANLLNESPTLMMRLEEKERRVILFAAKNGLISEELSRQVSYHAARLKDFDNKIYTALVNLYEKYESKEILEAICMQLLRGGKYGDKYFNWYALAIENNLPLNNLYEAYMASINLLSDHPLPKPLLMYFSYQNNLPLDQIAYIYAYMVKNRDNYPDLYMTYRDDISRFILKNLYAGVINRDLAYLYNEILLRKMGTVDNLRQFANVVLVHCIRIEDPSISSVVVIDERMKEELVYPVTGGKAYVTLPSSEYTVLLEDPKGHRYYMTKEYITEMYFIPRKLLPQIEQYAEDSLLLDLFICDGNRDYVTVTDRNVSRYRYLEQSKEVDDDFRAAIRLPLVRFYQDRDDYSSVDEILSVIDKTDVLYKDRDELLRVFINRGMLDRAYEYILYYGPESVDPQILVRVATLLIERDGFVDDEKMKAVIWAAFERGKYNDTVLTYLARYFKGSVKNLRNVWKAASGFYIDTYNICEAMISQTLMTGAYIGEEVQILKEYVDGGAKTELEQEYLNNLAYEHFVRDRVVDGYMFQEMERLYDNEGKLSEVCMLAFLKYHSENSNIPALDDGIKAHIRRFIHILYVEKGMIMPFMKAFGSISMDALEMSNLSMVEYRGNEDAIVTIHYCISQDDDAKNGYTRNEMTNVYGGVFVKSFLLFFGETLQYYITEKTDGVDQLTESGSISCNDVDIEPGTDRYNLVNDIALSTTLKDYETALELLEEYKYKEYLVTNLFRPQ